MPAVASASTYRAWCAEYGLPRNAADLNPADLPDHSHMATALEAELRRLVADWDTITRAQKARIVAIVEQMAQDGRLDDLLDLRVDTADAQEALLRSMRDLGSTAANQVVDEARAQGVDIAAVSPGQQGLVDVAAVVAALLGAELVVSASRAAMRANHPGATAKDVAAATAEHLGSLSGANAETQLGGALHGAMNAGRVATLLQAPEAALYASEVMDRNTCKPCRRINGKWLGNSSQMEQVLRLYPSAGYGGYIDCEGGVRCRGTVVAVWRPAQVAEPGMSPAARAEALRRLLAREYKRDKDGRFASGGGRLTGQAALDAAPATYTSGPGAHSGDYAGAVFDAPAGAGSERALAEYEGVEYQRTNDHLRLGVLADGKMSGPDLERARELDAETTARIAEIDKTMAVSRLTGDVEVHRVVQSGRAVFGDSYYNADMVSRDVGRQNAGFDRWQAGERPDLTGLKFRNAGYTSTTANPAYAESFGAGWARAARELPSSEGEPILMRMAVPAGTGAIQLGSMGTTMVHGKPKLNSAELMLERGLTMEVTADHGVNADGFRELDVSVVVSG